MTKKKKRKNTYKRRKNTYKRRKNTYKRRSSYKKRKSKKRFRKKYKSNKKLIVGGASVFNDLLEKLKGNKTTPTQLPGPEIGHPIRVDEANVQVTPDTIKAAPGSRGGVEGRFLELESAVAHGVTAQQILNANYTTMAKNIDTKAQQNKDKSEKVTEALKALNENQKELQGMVNQTIQPTMPPIPKSLLEMYPGTQDYSGTPGNSYSAFDFMNTPQGSQQPMNSGESSFNYGNQGTPPVARIQRRQGRRRIGVQ